MARHRGRETALKRVLAVDPASARKVAPLQFRKQSREVRRIVLAVSVQGGNDGAGRGLKPGPQSSALPATDPVPQTSNERGVHSSRLVDPVPSRVSAPVVHEHQFKSPALPLERRENLFGQRQDIPFLVADGDDDGNIKCHNGTLIGSLLMESLFLSQPRDPLQRLEIEKAAIQPILGP